MSFTLPIIGKITLIELLAGVGLAGGALILLKPAFGQTPSPSPTGTPTVTNTPTPSGMRSTGVSFPMYNVGAMMPSLVAQAQAHPKLPFKVIVNPASGPGSGPNSTLFNQFTQLTNAPNITLEGYIPTGYAYAKNTNLNSIGGISLAFNFGSGPGWVRVVDFDGSETARVQSMINAGLNGTGPVICTYSSPLGTDIRGVAGIVNMVSEVQKYRDWYPMVHGIFLDEFFNGTTAAKIDHYRALCTNAKANQQVTKIHANPGTGVSSSAYFDFIDDMLIREGGGIPSTSAIQSVSTGSFGGVFPKSRFSMDADCVSNLTKATVDSFKPYVGYMFFTNFCGDSGGRYTQLDPTYFANLCSYLDA